MYRAVTFNEQETGEQQRATVGHTFNGRRVLAIGGDGDSVTIVSEGGAVATLACGQIVSVEAMDAEPVPRREAVSLKRAPALPRGPAGAIVAVEFSGQFGQTMVAIGDSHTYESQVVSIAQGDPGRVVLANGRAVPVEAGTVRRWHFATEG